MSHGRLDAVAQGAVTERLGRVPCNDPYAGSNPARASYDLAIVPSCKGPIGAFSRLGLAVEAAAECSRKARLRWAFRLDIEGCMSDDYEQRTFIPDDDSAERANWPEPRARPKPKPTRVPLSVKLPGNIFLVCLALVLIFGDSGPL